MNNEIIPTEIIDKINEITDSKTFMIKSELYKLVSELTEKLIKLETEIKILKEGDNL